MTSVTVQIPITICGTGADMYYRRSGQMDLTDRVAIETGLCRGESFKKIAHQIGRHPSTIAHEVLENRTITVTAPNSSLDEAFAQSHNVQVRIIVEP